MDETNSQNLVDGPRRDPASAGTKRRRRCIITQPLPRDMNPSRHGARRAARARTLSTNFGKDPRGIYTHASQPRGKPYATLVASSRNSHLAELNCQDHELHRNGGDGDCFGRHTRSSPTRSQHVGTANRVVFIDPPIASKQNIKSKNQISVDGRSRLYEGQ